MAGLTTCEPALIARMFPPERAIMGMRVCKWTREGLSLCCTRVIYKMQRQKAMSSSDDVLTLSRCFSLFQCHGVAVDLSLRESANVGRVLSALQIAREDGWAGKVVNFRLSHVEASGLCSNERNAFEVFSDIEEVCLQKVFFTPEDIAALSKVAAQCTSLQHFNISGTRIGRQGLESLVPVLVQCTALSRLHLCSANFGDDAERLLGQLLEGCKGLKHVNLSDNWNIYQPDSTGILARSIRTCQALTHLELGRTNTGDSSLTQLGESLAQCENLTFLGLADNSFSSDGTRMLASALPRCKSLQELSLGNNRMRSRETVRLLQGASQCSSLTTLHLGGNQISCEILARGAGGVRYTECLFDTFPHCRAYTRLDLSRNALGTFTSKRPEPRRRQRGVAVDRLTELDLSSNVICDAGMRGLAGLLRGCSGLRRLNLSTNSIGASGMAQLDGFLAASSGLSSLDLTLNNLGDEGAAHATSRVLGRNTRLQELQLRENMLGAPGMQLLAASLAACRDLVRLDVSANALGPAGVRSLCEALAKLRKLEGLGLASNQMGDAGAAHLAGVLEDSHALRHLNLQWNDITARGAFHLACVMGQCRKIEALELGGNNLGKEGGWLVAGALAGCPQLRTMDLEGNNIGDQGASRLAGVLGCCSSLTRLNLSMNDIGSEATMQIAREMHHCRALVDSHPYQLCAMSGTERVCCCQTNLDLSFNAMGQQASLCLLEVAFQSSYAFAPSCAASSMNRAWCHVLAQSGSRDGCFSVPYTDDGYGSSGWCHRCMLRTGTEIGCVSSRLRKGASRFSRSVSPATNAALVVCGWLNCRA